MNIKKIVSIEIDSELFFNEISMDTCSWHFDLYDLEEHPKVYEYIMDNESEIIEALKTGEADYVEVYRDF